MHAILSLIKGLWSLLKQFKSVILKLVALGVTFSVIALIAGKIYQHWDDDPDRGAIAISNGEFGEDYSTPVYLNQGWSASDSLWFYNITQGSGLLPYDFYLNLELKDSDTLIRDNSVIDKYRYLPQKPTFFNPDGLAVGFAKETYQGKDYMGFTCAACHTGQVNYQGKAIRIDGAPTMANMVEYLHQLEWAMEETLTNEAKNKRFVEGVLALNNDYDSAEQINQDLEKWANTVELYNTVNHSHVKYGYGRLDAFGRIYNRVLQYVPNKHQIYDVLTQATTPTGRFIVTTQEAENVLQGINETIIGEEQFVLILDRLQSKDAGFPGLGQKDMLRVRNAIFNEPDAPVSYPFLWDIAQSDYVQWNGVASNADLGPIGRNTGEVIGVFGILDWTASDPSWSLSTLITKQDHKNKVIDFKSSIDLTNLERIENHLAALTSPEWPKDILGAIDEEKAKEGRKLYGEYCQGCHELVNPIDADRIIVANFSAIENIGTDPAMAENSVFYKGKSGNFKHTYQSTGVGNVVIAEDAPVVQILTSATKGVVATPDADKWFFRRWADWFYTVGASVFYNPVKASSVKAGNYNPDTTASPYNSLLAYKARSLNGIWATAPYLHNGSVPTLYDLLLPVKKDGDPEAGEYRPNEFMVGSREFDPVKVGFRSEGYEGSVYRTNRRANFNTGHEYAAGKTAQLDGSVLPALNKEERMQLLEFLKTL